jgi:hypothetical protein
MAAGLGDDGDWGRREVNGNRGYVTGESPYTKYNGHD